MALTEAINELKGDLFKLHPDNERIYNLIEGLTTQQAEKQAKSQTIYTSAQNSTQFIKLVFIRDASANDQVVFALKYLNRVAKANEIAAAIKEFDPTFDKGLSTPFYKLREAGKIDVYNPSITDENPEGSNHQVYYGLSEWFEGKNKVKPEYWNI